MTEVVIIDGMVRNRLSNVYIGGLKGGFSMELAGVVCGEPVFTLGTE